MNDLYTSHVPPLQILYAEVERFALSQPQVFIGTPGSVTVRTNASGFTFYSRQYFDGEGKKREEYIAGPVGSVEADAKAAALKGRIAEAKACSKSIRLLGREGFNLVDAKTIATLASLHNHGIFRAGALLVGSHAYGVLLNRLGIRAASYFTEDVDIARRETLALERIPAGGILEILQQTGINFVAVPQLDHRVPPTSYKEAGVSRFHVDLLVPAADASFPVVPVPELKAHATGLPYLAYLLEVSQTGAMLSREGCVAVRIPLPERFALHKLIVSQLRVGREAKSEKDIVQAAVLLAALGDKFPGAIDDALEAVPKSARKFAVRAIRALAPLLAEQHPKAWLELSGHRNAD